MNLSSLRLFLRLRRFLPRIFIQPLLERFWCDYWKRAEVLEAKDPFAPRHLPIRHSERAQFVEVIAEAYPFKSILELGCSYGQNFHTLGELFPDCALIGIDRDSARIEEGNRLLAAEGFARAKLVQGVVEDLSDFPDACADLVICCALLLYIPPDKIEQVAREMLRLAKKAVVILEQHVPSADGEEGWRGQESEAGVLSVPGVAYWLRDYQQLFRRVVSAQQVTVCKVPQPRWEAEQWRRYAAVVRVLKE